MSKAVDQAILGTICDMKKSFFVEIENKYITFTENKN